MINLGRNHQLINWFFKRSQMIHLSYPKEQSEVHNKSSPQWNLTSALCQEHCVINYCIHNGWRVGMLKFVMYLKLPQNNRTQFLQYFCQVQKKSTHQFLNYSVKFLLLCTYCSNNVFHWQEGRKREGTKESLANVLTHRTRLYHDQQRALEKLGHTARFYFLLLFWTWVKALVTKTCTSV